MPKRKSHELNNSDSDDEYILRKIKKLERKLMKRNRKRSSSLSSEDSNPAVSIREDNHPEESEEADVTIVDENMDCVINTGEPSASTAENPSEPGYTLDDNILEMLGENPSKNKKFSSPIQAELAVRWEYIATKGLPRDIKKELLEKYSLPENCLKVGAPSLNPEVKAALSDTLIRKEQTIQSKQNQQAIAISCISQALTKIFASETKDAEVIKLLIDAVRLMCDFQHTETMSRRSFVTSTIKKDIKDHLYATEVDNFLFGEQLSETLKTARAINKSATEMKKNQIRTTNFSQTKHNQPRPLNSKPPLSLTRQAGAGRRSAPVTHQPRRYQAPPLPPPYPTAGHQPTYPTAGHQPPPPAPPQRSRARTQTRR